jgi:ORF6N domain
MRAKKQLCGYNRISYYLSRFTKAAVPRTKAQVPTEVIASTLLVLRRHRVILDAQLASLYGVSTKRFNEQVRRNRRRFPPDFMFQLTPEEFAALRSQFATSKTRLSRPGRGGRRYLPHVFTEHGAIQAANVLNSSRAIEMGIYVVRAFVQLREVLASNKDLAQRLDQLEASIEKRLTGHDDAIAAMLSAIRQLMRPPSRARRGIGFTADLQGKPE